MENEVICASTLEERQLEKLNQSRETLQKRILRRFYSNLDNFSDDKHITKKNKRAPSPSSKYIPASKDKECRQHAANKTEKLHRHLPKSINDVASSCTCTPVSHNINHIPKDRDDVHIKCTELKNLNDVNDDNDVNDVNDVNYVNNCEIQHDSHTCCEVCRVTQRIIMKKLDFIINFIENMDAACKNIESNKKLLPAFPLATTEDFFKFEEELQQDKEVRKQFKNEIAKIGGRSYSNKTRNIMKFIIHDSVAKKLSWTGQKQSMAIKNTVFASIITVYIVSTEKCSLYEVQKVIQEWLRHAGDRLNYLLKK